MIRYIKIGDQIDDDCNAFAFYDTVATEFIKINHNDVWDTVSEFVSDYHNNAFIESRPLKRFLSLMHDREKEIAKLKKLMGSDMIGNG